MADARTARQAAMLADRLQKSARHLGKWARREGVTCYRLYDRDIPEVPLAVDWYEGRLHVAEYAPPRGEPDPDRAARIAALAAAAADALGVPPAQLFLKTRARQRGARQYQRVADAGAEVVVGEGGHRFAVNLSDYVDTGLFLDHRQTRALVAAEAKGRRFLNLFCYTASFTVYAAAAGAAATTSVDLSNRYLDWARRNLALNRLWSGPHRLIRADALAFLAEHRERYDLVVVDPPTFSNSKKMQGVLDVQRDHARLLARVLELTAPGGAIYFSTNARRFSFDPAALAGAAAVEEITRRTVPPDFRARPPHRCWRIGG